MFYLISIRKARLQTVVDMRSESWRVSAEDHREIVHQVIFCLSIGKVIETEKSDSNSSLCYRSSCMVSDLIRLAGHLLATVGRDDKLGWISTGQSRNVRWEDLERGTAILDEKVLSSEERDFERRHDWTIEGSCQEVECNLKRG